MTTYNNSLWLDRFLYEVSVADTKEDEFWKHIVDNLGEKGYRIDPTSEGPSLYCGACANHFEKPASSHFHEMFSSVLEHHTSNHGGF